MSKFTGSKLKIFFHTNTRMYYLQLLGKVVGHEGSEGGKQWCKEHAHIAYVYGDVQPIKYMIDGG